MPACRRPAQDRLAAVPGPRPGPDRRRAGRARRRPPARPRLLFDGTNFFPFLDTFNDRSTLAQRGKSKQGRASLRIVGLALLVSADFHVPLLHRTYPGNQHDAPTFSSLVQGMVAPP